MTTNTVIPEIDSLKTRLQTIWTAGEYDRFSRYMEGGARDFYERLQVAPGCRLLDVGCGSGQLALIAAKDGLEVTGVDIAANWVERAQARARAEGVRVRFEVADAEALPYDAASFDVVTSLIGAMFAPRPELVARAPLRRPLHLARPGARHQLPLLRFRGHRAPARDDRAGAARVAALSAGPRPARRRRGIAQALPWDYKGSPIPAQGEQAWPSLRCDVSFRPWWRSAPP